MFNPEALARILAARDKTLTPSPWTTLMDYPNGLPLKWTTPKKWGKKGSIVHTP